jgi:hypothetical protein
VVIGGVVVMEGGGGGVRNLAGHVCCVLVVSILVVRVGATLQQGLHRHNSEVAKNEVGDAITCIYARQQAAESRKGGCGTLACAVLPSFAAASSSSPACGSVTLSIEGKICVQAHVCAWRQL